MLPCFVSSWRTFVLNWPLSWCQLNLLQGIQVTVLPTTSPTFTSYLGGFMSLPDLCLCHSVKSKNLKHNPLFLVLTTYLNCTQNFPGNGRTWVLLLSTTTKWVNGQCLISFAHCKCILCPVPSDVGANVALLERKLNRLERCTYLLQDNVPCAKAECSQ